MIIIIIGKNGDRVEREYFKWSALILAQAERIKEGSDYTLFKIEKVN